MDVHVRRAFAISYEMVARAYHKVKQGGKAAGIDQESWQDFEQKGVGRQLYLIWNRMASGSYFPSYVKEVEIPKKDGRVRKLGIPTIRDRIAQEVARRFMEQKIDDQFHEHSYGYRPLKSSHEAIEEVQKNCLKKDWVIDLDISNFFDELDHNLLMKAVEALIEDHWVRLYVKRWLEGGVEKKNGEQYKREKGTPQGGVISPLLANIYLHFALDLWLNKHYPTTTFVRYADDIVIHCQSKEEAEEVLQAIEQRLKDVRLQLNQKKTRIVYCKDYLRKGNHEQVQFEFLGFSFQPRAIRSVKHPGTSFTGFSAEISRDNQQKIRREVKGGVDWEDTTQHISDIANLLNNKLRGWVNYFDLYKNGQLRRALLCVDERLLKWLMKKHKCRSRGAMRERLASIQRSQPRLFYHWEKRYCFNVQKLTRAV